MENSPQTIRGCADMFKVYALCRDLRSSSAQGRIAGFTRL